MFIENIRKTTILSSAILLLILSPLTHLNASEVKLEGKETLKIIVTGDTSETYIGTKDKIMSAFITCDKDGAGLKQNVLSIKSMKGSKLFNLSIPLSVATVGTHDIVGVRDNTRYQVGIISLEYISDRRKGKSYVKNVEGTVTFANIPTKEGEYLKGTLTATATKKKDKKAKVTLNVIFDIEAGNQTFEKCQK